MTSVFGVTSMSFDKLLTLYLSEGMMIFTALLLIASIIAFVKGKGRKALRTGCIVVGIYCVLYLGAILALSFLFSSNHEPPQPTNPNSSEVRWDVKPSVMIDGVLYGSTGKSGIYSTDTTPENGGLVDGEITSTVESHEYPTEDNQSNFGSGFYYRHGENHVVEIFFDDSNKWIIFEPYKEHPNDPA